MSFTLVLTSYDRPADLERFFRSLTGQTFQGPIEVNFVNQNLQRPASCALLAAPVALNELVIGQRIPLSKARNLAMTELSGDIVAFPDDDCWYEPQLLEKIATYFEANAAVDCICTNVFDPDRGLPYGKRPPGVTSTISFSNVFRLGISVGIFVRKTALRKAGARFDERLGAGTPIGSGEETELLARLLAAQCRIEYVGGFQVYHPVAVFALDDIKKNYRYGLGSGHLNARMLRDGHPGVLWGFAEVLLRSFGGVAVNLFRPVSRAVYWNRFAGLTVGFAAQLIHPPA